MIMLFRESYKKAFDKIAEGLQEALAVAQGSVGNAKLHVPAEIDVKAIRRKTKMSQDQSTRQHDKSES